MEIRYFLSKSFLFKPDWRTIEALELYFEDKSVSDIHKVDSAKVVSLELQNA